MNLVKMRREDIPVHTLQLSLHGLRLRVVTDELAELGVVVLDTG